MLGTDVIRKELLAFDISRGDLWTAGVFLSRGSSWWGHVKWMDEGYTELGFKDKESAVNWVVRTLEQVIRDHANRSPAEEM